MILFHLCEVVSFYNLTTAARTDVMYICVVFLS